MKRTSPTWLSAYRVPRLFVGKSASMVPGEIRPSSDGPSRMPAIISPTTSGWPTNLTATATRRTVPRITAIWRNSSFRSGIASLDPTVLFSPQARNSP
jgi:hypothetical protein